MATTFRKRMPLLIEERQTSNVSPDVKNLKYTLSMGHNIHDLSIGPNSDVIKVVQYIAKFTQNNSRNKSTYHYMLWMPFKQVSDSLYIPKHNNDFIPLIRITNLMYIYIKFNHYTEISKSEPDLHES